MKKNKINIMKKLALPLLLILSTQSHASDFNLAESMEDFYRIYKQDTTSDYYLKSLNRIIDFDKTREELQVRTIVDYIDHCAESNESYKLACLTILSKAGHYDALRGLSEYYYNQATLNNDNYIKQMKYLIFSAQNFGIAEGLRDLDLDYSAPYRSFRMTFNDLINSELLDNYSSDSFINEFYQVGLYKSLDFKLSPLLGKRNELDFSDLNYDVDLDEETKRLVSNGDFIDIFNELRELITNEEGINYLIRKAANEEYEDIFVSLLRGSNGFPEERHISIFTLYDQGVNKNNDKALYYLIQESYRRHTLNRDDDNYNNEYLDDVKLLSALLKNRNPDFNNEIFELILNNSSSHLNFIKEFNTIRKNYTK